MKQENARHPKPYKIAKIPALYVDTGDPELDVSFDTSI